MKRPDYGLDAPGVIRNLSLAAAAGLGLFTSVALHLWSGLVQLGPITLEVSGMGLGVALGCGFGAAAMIYSSKRGKLSSREKLLDRHTWTGAERVLDVGCGRGLLLVGAARRLTSGSAVGIDIWQQEDLAGNGADGALENARLEGVAAKVRVETADMRTLPFPNGAFEVIVSKAAIHNLYERSERTRALHELARVLAPGGQLLIDDIRHLPEYQADLRAAGLVEVEVVSSAVVSLLYALGTFGSLRPGVLSARKA